jgi:hypothetical protein
MRRREGRHLQVQRLSDREVGTLQDDDAGTRRVNPALPDACRTKGLPSHPTLSAARKTATEPVLLMLGSFSGIASRLRACGLTTEMGVAGSAPRSGRGGRRFKSYHSDHLSRRSDCLRGQLCGTKR